MGLAGQTKLYGEHPNVTSLDLVPRPHVMVRKTKKSLQCPHRDRHGPSPRRGSGLGTRPPATRYGI